MVSKSPNAVKSKKKNLATTSNPSLKWIRLCGVMALAAIIFTSVMLPTKWEQVRTGHWAVEHFLAYFVATSILCLGWRRPFVHSGSPRDDCRTAARGPARFDTKSLAQSPVRNQRSWRSVDRGVTC